MDFKLNAKGLLECIKQQGSKRGTIGTSLRKYISLSRQFPAVLYFMTGAPEHFLRR